MNQVFTPNEAAALVEISPKCIYKEIEYLVIPADAPEVVDQSGNERNRLSFGTLVYLRALKEINFDFSVSYRVRLHQALKTAWEQQVEVATLEFAKFFMLQVGEIVRELQTTIEKFEAWKAKLASDPNILGGEIVFPNSRLSVRRIGGALERGESLETLQQDYPYLTDEDFNFALMYIKAYPIQGRPKTQSSEIEE